MKFLIVFFTVFCKIATAQFLTVDNLQHLTAGSVQNLDVKLAEHFKLERNPDMEDDHNRVYSGGHHHTDNFKVLTVFTRAKNCLALSLVTHNETEVMNFHTDLIRQGFKQERYKDAEGNPLKKYSKQNFVVIIKNPDSKLPAHQVVWSCR